MNKTVAKVVDHTGELTHSQIISMIQTGAKYGMQSMDQCLKKLVMEGKVSAEEAAAKASNPNVRRQVLPLLGE